LESVDRKFLIVYLLNVIVLINTEVKYIRINLKSGTLNVSILGINYLKLRASLIGSISIRVMPKTYLIRLN